MSRQNQTAICKLRIPLSILDFEQLLNNENANFNEINRFLLYNWPKFHFEIVSRLTGNRLIRMAINIILMTLHPEYIIPLIIILISC